MQKTCSIKFRAEAQNPSYCPQIFVSCGLLIAVKGAGDYVFHKQVTKKGHSIFLVRRLFGILAVYGH